LTDAENSNKDNEQHMLNMGINLFSNKEGEDLAGMSDVEKKAFLMALS